MRISPLHPGRVCGLGGGKCMDAGDWRSGRAGGVGFVQQVPTRNKVPGSTNLTVQEITISQQIKIGCDRT